MTCLEARQFYFCPTKRVKKLEARIMPHTEITVGIYTVH